MNTYYHPFSTLYYQCPTLCCFNFSTYLLLMAGCWRWCSGMNSNNSYSSSNEQIFSIMNSSTYLTEFKAGYWRWCSCINPNNKSEIPLKNWCVLPSISKLIYTNGSILINVLFDTHNSTLPTYCHHQLPTHCTPSVIINNDATNIYHKHHSYNAFAVLVDSKIYENT